MTQSSEGDDQIGSFVDVEVGPWRDHCCGAVFGNNGWAGILLSGLEFFASVDLRSDNLAIKQDQGFVDGNPAALCSARTAEDGRPHTMC